MGRREGMVRVGIFGLQSTKFISDSVATICLVTGEIHLGLFPEMRLDINVRKI